MPDSPDKPWLDDEHRCRYWTGHDNFLYSDELPGGLAVQRFPNAVGFLHGKHTAYVRAAWPGGNGILGAVEEEAPSPGAESSSDSDSSEDSEPGPE